MNRVLIKNGRVIDPANCIDAVMDVFVENGVISAIHDSGTDLHDSHMPKNNSAVEQNSLPTSDIKIIDATGLWVTPGLIDMHVHFRDPGWPLKETIASGTAAAAAGGFTTVCPMANTDPVTDSPEVVRQVISKAIAEGHVHVIPIGSITKGLGGIELSPISEMKAAGICAVSDDGKTVDNAVLYKAAMEHAAACGLPVLAHCEDLQLVCGGHINAGAHAKALGVKGISNESESEIIARDIRLAKEVILRESKPGLKLHICHVSTAEGVSHIRAAQKEGLPITAEVCPHHFTLADEDIPCIVTVSPSQSPDPNYKMSPPLRSRKDIAALKSALKDGTIAVIATDHAPHHEDDKSVGIEKAANGIIGLETAVSLCITELVNTGTLTPSQLIAKLTINPARIIGIDKGTLSVGKMADITIIDPTKHHIIDKQSFRSKSRNTPFHGRAVWGQVQYTIVEGKIVYDNRQAD